MGPLQRTWLLCLLTWVCVRQVFKHSSAHILGASLEAKFGVKLCIGPPTEEGFYYDAYMGSDAITEPDYKAIEQGAKLIVKQAHKFERLTLTKEQALDLFKVRVVGSKQAARPCCSQRCAWERAAQPVQGPAHSEQGPRWRLHLRIPMRPPH